MLENSRSTPYNVNGRWRGRGVLDLFIIKLSEIIGVVETTKESYS